MSEYRLIAAVMFFFAFLVSTGFLASTDPVHPIEEIGPPISTDEFSIQHLLSDVPQIAPVALPDPANTSQIDIVTAGVPVIEGVEAFFRGMVDAADQGFRYLANFIIFALNLIISGMWLISKMVALFISMIRIDLWPAFQTHPVLQIVGTIMSMIIGGVVLLFLILLIRGFIPFVGGR